MGASNIAAMARGLACATWMALCTGSALALPPGPAALIPRAIRQARTAASGSCAPKQVPLLTFADAERMFATTRTTAGCDVSKRDPG